MNNIKKFQILRTVASLGVALLVSFIIIALVSDTPLETIKTFIITPFTQKRYIGNIIEGAIPLIFSGLALSVVFQAKLFNLGAEGIFYIAGVLISYIAINFVLPPVVHQGIIILVGAIIGALVMLIPALLKAKYNASELVTSLMMNSILFGFGAYFLNTVIRDVNAGNQSSLPFNDTAMLSDIISGTRVHTGIIIAIVVALATYFFLYKTKWGYEIRMTGSNKEFAKYSGINVFKVVIVSHVVSGMLAGMGGAIEIIGMHKKFEWMGLPGFGFDGALIALLASNNPISVIFSALFVAYLRVGASLISRLSDVPYEMISIIQAIVILLISAEKFLQGYKQRLIEKGVR